MSKLGTRVATCQAPTSHYVKLLRSWGATRRQAEGERGKEKEKIKGGGREGGRYREGRGSKHGDCKKRKKNRNRMEEGEWRFK